MGDMTDRAEGVGQQAQQSEWMDKAIRAGLVAYGVVHLLVGWLALQLAFGESEGKASNKGAMQELAQQPFGEVLVWAIAIGMFLLVLWRGLETTVGHRDKEEGADRWKARAVSVLKAVIYAAIGISALNVVIGAKSSKGGSTWTKTVMEWPAGQWIVAAVGVAVILYGANHIRKGFTEDYAKHLDAEGKSGQTGKAYLLFGKVGYIGKGIAIAIVGGLVLYGGLTHDAKKSGSLDQALHKLLTYPFGQVMLIVVAAGIICYGLFCFARARHLSPTDNT
jgi:MFS family permease